MKTIAKIIVALILICGLAAGGIYYYLFQAGDKTPLQQLVPSDALAYADIKESRKFALEIATSGQAAAFAEIGKLVSGFFAVAQSSQATNENADSSLPAMPALQWGAILDAATHFSRQIAVFALESEIEELPFQAYVLAHFQGDPEGFKTAIQTFIDSANRELLAKQSEAPLLSLQTETIDNHAIHFVSLPQAETGIASVWELHPCWTVFEDKCVFGLNPDSLAEYLDSLKTITPETSLGKRSDFALASEYQPKMDGQAYLNLERLVNAATLFGNDTIGPMISQAGVSIDRIVDAMGLREMETSFYAYDFDAASSLLTNGIVFRERKGLLSLYSRPASISLPSFIPDNSYTSNSMALDVGEAILTLKDIVLQAAPLTAIMYPNYKAIVDQQIGQDVETFAREAFTDEIHSFSELVFDKEDDAGLPQFSQSQTWILGLSNESAFRMFLDDQLAPFRSTGLIRLMEEDVAGFKLFTLMGESAADSPLTGYAIAQGKLFIGHGVGRSALKSLKTSLELLASNNPDPFLSPKASQFIADKRENAVSVFLADFGILLDSARRLVSGVELSARRDNDTATLDALRQIDWAAIENFDLKLIGVSQEEEHLLLTRAQLFSE